MSVTCIICTDQLNSDENLQSTRCGHIFHHHCVLNWLQNSNTCPQCRKVVTNRGLCRVYPTFSEEENTESAELQSSLADTLQELGRLQTACEEKDVHLKNVTDTNNSSEQRWKERLANALQSQNTEMVQLRRQFQQLKKENEDLTRQLRRVDPGELETLTYQVDMLKMSLECSMNRERDSFRELHQLRQDSIVREAVIWIISGTIGFAFGIYFYPYIYPMPVQQSCWQKSVGVVSSYINRLFFKN